MHTGQLDVMLEYLWQVHGVDFYSGDAGELSVELYKSVKEQMLRSTPEVEFRAVRVARPQSDTLVDDKRRTLPLAAAALCALPSVGCIPIGEVCRPVGGSLPSVATWW